MVDVVGDAAWHERWTKFYDECADVMQAAAAILSAAEQEQARWDALCKSGVANGKLEPESAEWWKAIAWRMNAEYHAALAASPTVPVSPSSPQPKADASHEG